MESLSKKCVLSLEGIREDGWLDRLMLSSPELRQIAAVLGTSFTAQLLVSGLRLVAVLLDERNPEASRIQFEHAVGGIRKERTAFELHKELVTAFTSQPYVPPFELSREPSPEEIRAWLGTQILFLAPIYRIELLAIEWSDGGLPLIVCRTDGQTLSLRLEELDQLLRTRILAERVPWARPRSWSIDMASLMEAERAAQAGNHARVLEILESWIEPLALLVRSSVSANLSSEIRQAAVRALGMIATANAAIGQREWAEEIYRLGIQWNADSPEGALLYKQLGEMRLEADRAGEAIGLFCRALLLWDKEPERYKNERALTLLALARAFAARHRWLAALACIRQSKALGLSSPLAEEIRTSAHHSLGESWTQVEAFLDQKTE
ncbi:MAG: hypothetical protein NZM37_01650 [Sandaracinaceae bacterium]|nr:hypothetical protein [Sandaracinaceae bacterium]